MSGKYLLIKTVILLTLLSINLCWPDWIKKAVGTYNSILDIKVGDGRNDGVRRVYCGCTNGHVVEWSFNNNINIIRCETR